jgi:bifunctional oligoribonuclease and PAP phosphatase NrnA
VAAWWGNDPWTKPRFMSALPLGDLVVPPAKFPERPEVLVTLDTASPDRLGTLQPRLEAAGAVICIDHHVTNPGFGTINLVEPRASSTAEVVYHLIEAMDGKVSSDSAACLYAGIVTDTGRFQYDATTPETLRVAAKLREAGFDHARLARALYEDNSLPFLKALGIALGRVTHVEEAGLVWTYLAQADLAKTGLTMGDTDDLIDVIRTVREADVAAVIKEQRDGTWKVSLRSKGGHDVGGAAAAFGGGGHRLASGYTSPVGPEETVKALAPELKQRANGAA